MSIEIHKDAVIIGGGLAGLTVASRLAKKGKSVVLLEKSLLGGRAITTQLKGFSFNFGAHAVYAKDKSLISILEKELELKLNWKSYDKSKARYDKGVELSAMPSDIKGLFETTMLSNRAKFSFALFILKTMLKKYKPTKEITITEWFTENNIQPDVQHMLLTLASSNFFTNEPDCILASDYFSYYERVFKTKQPVTYLMGGWQSIINELNACITDNGGEVLTKSKVADITFDGNKVQSVITKNATYTADSFIFCVPPKELSKLFAESDIHTSISRYACFEPSYVIYYDIGLSERIPSNLSYVYDVKENIFVTDISSYDSTCSPKGGQLLQSIAYANENNVRDDSFFEETKKKIESVYDKHFPGWCDKLIVSRISKKAVVQEIKSKKGQSLMPISFPEYKNVWFAGDWCKGIGQLSELSFSSAYEVSDKILNQSV